MNIGEEIVKTYLEYVKKCEFVQTNLYTIEVQGEIDVIGINLQKETLYVCEVAVHLQTGLQYTKDNQPNNINKLTEKFSKDIEYVKKHLSKYEHVFMLWSPVVKDQANSKYNQLDSIKQIQKNIRDKYGIEIHAVINNKFLECIEELREVARKNTKDIKSPILRFLQIEEIAKLQVKRLNKQANKYDDLPL
jgi:hypothetical protein